MSINNTHAVSTAEFALTPLQLAMVYESTLAGRPWVNLEQVVVHLDDEVVDSAELTRAWNSVASVHEALRLSILWRKRVTPVQIVRDSVAVQVTVEDWSLMTARRQSNAMAQFLEDDRTRGVDLEGAPAWRVMLIRLGPRASVMIWTVHHAMVDGRSIALVLGQVFGGLPGRDMGAQGPVSESPVTESPGAQSIRAKGFSQYAAARAAIDPAAAEAFFCAQLAGFDQPNAIANPEDPDQPTEPRRKVQIERRLDAALSRALATRADAADATLANLVHAAWGLVLARWSGDAAAVFGVTRSGRHLTPGFAGTVGCLINTLPVKVKITAPLGIFAVGAPMSGAPLPDVDAQVGASQVGEPSLGEPSAGLPMSGTAMSGTAVSGRPLSGPPLSGPPLSGPPMSGTGMSGAAMSGPPLSGAGVSGMQMSGATPTASDPSATLSSSAPPSDVTPGALAGGAAPRIDAVLADLRAGTLAMHAHEHAALTDIRRWCEVPGTLPLFETMVMFERESLTTTMRRAGPDWATRRVTLLEEGAMPVTLAVYGDPEILLMLEHDPARVPATRASAMLAHMAEVLAAMAAASGTVPLAQLTMLPRSEEAALLALGRPDIRLPAALPCMASRFEAAARATPDAPALSIVGGAGPLSFAALDAAANGLADALHAEGAGPGAIVAICLERSPDFVVAMLAVLKTGAAFLPVDPSYPRAVRDHMLINSGARLMVAGPATSAPAGLILVAPHRAPMALPPPRPAPDPDRLAYVIYTSGSTGVPKGVRVPMRAISAHASALSAAFALTAQDRVLQFASLSFDVAIEEVMPTLLAGAHLVMRDPAMAGSVPGFLAAIAGHGITVLNLPTAFWHMLVDEMARGSLALPPSVRLVIVGGEQISPRALATWARIAPAPRWLNGYGPTETTITCMLYDPGALHACAAPLPAGEDIPIGRPTAHARAYVLAADGSLAPQGAIGDLWIGGVAVSDGYIGQDAQTAAAFRPDRFAGEGHIYNTGDRARWRDDGQLAFLGRNDRQVKLRGFRIDLRQVERVLERDPSVGRALASVTNQGTPAARLVAWVTGSNGMPPPDMAGLRAAAERHLPAHMLPALVAIGTFPGTPGGKIDMSALPAPDAVGSGPSRPGDADATTLAICALMAETLGLPNVGPDDGFHDLGGHSLLAVQLIGRIEHVLGHRLGVGDLHRRPTPRALAATVNAAQTGPRYIIPIQPLGSKPPLFGVHVLGRNEEYYRPLAAELGPDQPLLGLSVGLLTQDTPIGVGDIARHYFDDIQRHHPQGPISLAAVSLGSYIAFELARLLTDAGRKVRLLALFDAEGPGGRSKIRGSARLMAHVRRARAEGLGYALHLVSNRLTDVRNKVEKARVRMASYKGEAAPMTIGTFVAANELAVLAYEAQPLPVPLTIFRAAADVFDSPESARNGLGWAPVAEAGFEVIDVAGDHLSILQPPNVKGLADHIARQMRKD